MAAATSRQIFVNLAVKDLNRSVEFFTSSPTRRLRPGGSPANEPMEMDFMYGRSFHDPDGHLWEVFWMNPSAAEG